MKGHFPKRFFRPILWGTLMVVFLTAPSFSQASSRNAGTVVIQKIEVTEAAGGTRVALEGSNPFAYTVYQLSNPLRLVLDLPQARLGKLVGPIEVQNGTINVIRSRQLFLDPKKTRARLEIGLSQTVEYDVTAEGNRLYVDFHRPGAAPPKEVKNEVKKEVKEEVREEVKKKEVEKVEKEVKEEVKKEVKNEVRTEEAPAKEAFKKAKVVKEVAIMAEADWVKVTIKGDGLLPDYRSLQMKKPARLVADLPGIINASSKKSIDVGSRFLKNIKIGQHPEKVRFVFNFFGADIPPFKMSQEGQELSILLGGAKEELAKGEKAPAAEVREAARPQRAEFENVTPPKETAAPAVREKTVIQTERTPEETKAADLDKAPQKNYKGQKVETAAPAVGEKTVIQAQGNSEEAKATELDKDLRKKYKGRKVSLDFKDADIHNIFRLIAEVSNLNIVTSEDVKGKITIRLVSVPWDQALDVILSTKNLAKIEEGNVIRITTAQTVEKERKAKQEEEKILVEELKSQERLEDLVPLTLWVNYASAEDLQKLIKEKEEKGEGLLSARGSVKADKRTNTLIVRDTRANLDKIQRLIKELDSPTPQVLIEARIVQASTTFSRTLGVQWGGSYNQTGGGRWTWSASGYDLSTGSVSPFLVNFPASTANIPAGAFGVSFGKLTGNLVNLDLRLSLGEQDGETKVIARPKLATLDYQKAYIKQGEKIPYETVSQGGTQVQFIDAVLLLEVTPHVTPDGSIKMTVKITRDARGSFRSAISGVPSIDNREASTEVLVKDGETLVIGGIYESRMTLTERGIPWLMQIPILGWLFKNQETESVQNELLVFITPTIIKARTES
jgi:type IV pilus assembly protein PilQ